MYKPNALLYANMHTYLCWIYPGGGNVWTEPTPTRTQAVFSSSLVQTNTHKSGEKSWGRWNPNHSETYWIFHNVFTGLSGASENCGVLCLRLHMCRFKLYTCAGELAVFVYLVEVWGCEWLGAVVIGCQDELSLWAAATQFTRAQWCVREQAGHRMILTAWQDKLKNRRAEHLQGLPTNM